MPCIVCDEISLPVYDVNICMCGPLNNHVNFLGTLLTHCQNKQINDKNGKNLFVNFNHSTLNKVCEK